MSSSRGSCQPRDWTHASALVGGFFTAQPPGRPTLLAPYCKDIVGQRCSTFWHQGLVSTDHDGGNRFRMMQVYYIYCALYFYYYDISSTSDHQALDPGGWDPYFRAHCVSLTEKAMAPHSSTLAWKIPWMGEPGRLQSMGSLRVRHDWATSLSLFFFMHWRRKWQPTPVFLPGEFQGQSLVGGHLWGSTELHTTEAT